MGATGTGTGVSFAIDEETRLLLDSLDEFVAREVEPLVDDLGDALDNPRRRHETDGRLADPVLDARAEIRRKSAEAGFYAMNLPGPDGEEPVSTVTWYRAKRHLASHGPGLTEAVLAGPEGPKPLLARAEGHQIERYLDPALRGEKTTAFAQTEPGVGSDSPNMATTARKDGDEWVLSGQKQWITNAPYADFVQVFARTTPQAEAGRHGGITCFIVEADEYEVGSLNNAVGWLGEQAELHFDDVRIPDDRVLGDVDKGFYAAMDFLSLGRLELGAEAVGFTKFLLDRGVDYANEREAFGQSIGGFQGVSHKLAEARARNFAADAAGLRTAWEMDQGEDAIESSSIFKYLATNVCFDAADDVIGVHGATGVSEDEPFADVLATARVLRIVEGTDEIQLNTIAKQLGVKDA
mgnify:CR=1 FL=1